MACKQGRGRPAWDPQTIGSATSSLAAGREIEMWCGVGHGRRRAGSVSARWRATASGPGRA
jgi:hypothetical protein